MKVLLTMALFAMAQFAFAAKPNIIVIMADDMGYADAGFTGSTDIKTPNLDGLAASGVTFRQGYVSPPFCGPSRAGLLSGRYQHRFGFEANPAYDLANPIMGIDPDERLFPARLHRQVAPGCRRPLPPQHARIRLLLRLSWRWARLLPHRPRPARERGLPPRPGSQ